MQSKYIKIKNLERNNRKATATYACLVPKPLVQIRLITSPQFKSKVSFQWGWGKRSTCRERKPTQGFFNVDCNLFLYKMAKYDRVGVIGASNVQVFTKLSRVTVRWHAALYCVNSVMSSHHWEQLKPPGLHTEGQVVSVSTDRLSYPENDCWVNCLNETHQEQWTHPRKHCSSADSLQDTGPAAHIQMNPPCSHSAHSGDSCGCR